MSRKSYTPDNTVCEGFFSRLKNEMFYNRSWLNVSIEEFIDEIRVVFTQEKKTFFRRIKSNILQKKFRIISRVEGEEVPKTSAPPSHL